MDKRDKEMSENGEIEKSAPDSIDSRRRRIAGAGLTAPVLMTLASRPALAKQCSASVLASGNLSDATDLSSCGSCTETQWYYQPSGSQAWSTVGINPDSDRVEAAFTVPMIDDNGAMIPILSATFRDALQANIQIANGLKYRNSSNQRVAKSAGRQQLKTSACIFCAALLNAAYGPTGMNFPYTSVQIATDVNSVLTLFGRKNNKIRIDDVTALANAFLAAIGTGSSCALPS